MHTAQNAISEVKGFWKRRKKLLILCPLLVLMLSAGAAYYLPSQYKSSITIMVEKSETLNPMVRYNMAVAMVSENRLQSFNQIIYSRPTMNMLIDSLGLAKDSPKDREKLIEEVKGNIHTQLQASNSFSITYYSKDPKLAKQGVKLLSQHFINTKQQFENQRNKQTVDFFQEKLGELKKTVNEREKNLMSQIEQNVQSTPSQDKNLQSNLKDIKSRIDMMSTNIRKTENQLETVQAVKSGKADPSKLLQLNLSQLSGGKRILEAVNSYQDVSEKYTSEYPEVEKTRQKVYTLTEQLEADLQSELFDQRAEKKFLVSQRKKVSNKIQQSTVAEKQTNQSQMNLDVYRSMYDEMKVKLEQAKTSRDLSKESKHQFKVIEPPIVPDEAAKPNKVMLMGGGLGLGLFLGLIIAVVAELLDTTIRRTRDLKEFNKPVVAYISKGDK